MHNSLIWLLTQIACISFPQTGSQTNPIVLHGPVLWSWMTNDAVEGYWTRQGQHCASLIKLITLVARVPHICSERCMGTLVCVCGGGGGGSVYMMLPCDQDSHCDFKKSSCWGKKKEEGGCLGCDWFLPQLQVGGASAVQGPRRSLSVAESARDTRLLTLY